MKPIVAFGAFSIEVLFKLCRKMPFIKNKKKIK